jgi:TonB family protein
MKRMPAVLLSLSVVLGAAQASAQALIDGAPPGDATAPTVDRSGDRDAVRRALKPGETLLRIIVDDHGRAESITVDTTSGNADNDKAAVDAVRRWRLGGPRRLMYLPMAHRISPSAPPQPIEK